MERSNPIGIFFPKLIQGKLVKRYKRFLADVELPDDSVVTAHCPNSGSMKACSEPGRTVYISQSDNPKRKLRYTWELIEMPTSLVGVNTLTPNRLVENAFRHRHVRELESYPHCVREIKISDHTRLDFLLEDENESKCYVEVKNCTLVVDAAARFPDAVTERGRKHLVEMQALVSQGHRCVMFYLIQRMDARFFSPADAIDPKYGAELRKAVANGVEILAYDVAIDLTAIRLNQKVPVCL